MKGRRLNGVVTFFDGSYYRIETDATERFLRDLQLVRWQMGKAKVGDRVVLEYQVTPSSGLWNVVEIVK